MKKLLFVLVSATTLTASAGILESFYGKVRSSGFNHQCTFYNNTGSTLDMKYVAFTFMYLSGDSADYDVQERIDRVVEPGETVSYSVREVHGHPRYCRFLAR